MEAGAASCLSNPASCAACSRVFAFLFCSTVAKGVQHEQRPQVI